MDLYQIRSAPKAKRRVATVEAGTVYQHQLPSAHPPSEPSVATKQTPAEVSTAVPVAATLLSDAAPEHRSEPAAIDTGAVDQPSPEPSEVSRRAPKPRPAKSAIPDDIRAKLTAIESRARALGWSHERLWNSGFWDSPRGLATCLEFADESVVEVGADFITIRSGRNIQRFYRTSAERRVLRSSL
jgi:hypothetical protein